VHSGDWQPLPLGANGQAVGETNPALGNKLPACRQCSIAPVPCWWPAPAGLPASSDGASCKGSGRSHLWNGRFQPRFHGLVGSSAGVSQPAARGRKAMASIMVGALVDRSDRGDNFAGTGGHWEFTWRHGVRFARNSIDHQSPGWVQSSFVGKSCAASYQGLAPIQWLVVKTNIGCTIA